MKTQAEGGLPKGTMVYADLAEASRHLISLSPAHA